MNYEQFVNEMLTQAKRMMSEAYVIERQEVVKNNGVRKIGFSIRREEDCVAPIFYLEDFYKEHLSGTTIECMVKSIKNYMEQQMELPEVNVMQFFVFENLKNQIIYKLINREKNAELLKDVPHLPMLDFAVVFYILVENRENEEGSILIRNSHMESWGVPISVLYYHAVKNTPLRYPPSFASLRELYEETEGIFGNSIYVLSNVHRIHGASVLLYPGLTKAIYEYIGCNYYLLPSSIHELLIIPENEEAEASDLQGIVRDVNACILKKEEFLSDDVYYFDGNIITKM